jgi:hypothetical protein
MGEEIFERFRGGVPCLNEKKDVEIRNKKNKPKIM